MRRFLIIITALLLVVGLHSGAYADDNDYLSIDTDAGIMLFKIDENGEMSYQANTEVVVTNDTVTVGESGKIFLMRGVACTRMTLPAADEGLVYSFVNGSTYTYELKPNGQDRIYAESLSAGDRLRSPATQSASVTIYGSDDSVWYADTHGFTFVDVGFSGN